MERILFKRGLGGVLLTIVSLAVALTSARGAVRSWKASTTGEWFEATNWVEGAVPEEDDDVFITNANASVLLTNSTPVLASLTVSQTLIATNWDTTISARDVRIVSGGMITTPVVTNNSSVSNRVLIVCSNLTLETGGQINVNSKGYGGGWAANGTANQPVNGQGPGASSSQGAAAFGGLGGEQWPNSSSAVRSGARYQSAASPTGPGSGGGSTDGRNGHMGGNGGGAVLIMASGHVLINGTITANGGGTGSSTTYAAAGSGGAIWIICRTFAGTNGLLSANGGDSKRAGGGGGRIAIHYNPEAQAALPIPEVTFTARGGLTQSPIGPACDADLGTLFLTDASWLYAPTLSHVGTLSFSNTPERLSFDSLTISNGWIRFPQGPFALIVSNDLRVVGSQGRLDLGGYGYYTASGLWRLLNEAATNATLEVGRHLILTNGGRMTIVSASTNSAAPFFGARVSVGQTLYLGTNCWITLVSSVTNGGSAFLTCRDLVVASNAGMIADALGFAGGRNSSGLGYRAVRYGGGGHGGAGGAYSSGNAGGQPHGLATNPLHAGTGGGAGDTAARYQNSAGYGGGVIRIEAADSLILDGTLSANGGDGGYNYSSGGAGGSINLLCVRFRGGPDSVIRANGGKSSPPVGGGGGGGRIRIARHAARSSFQGTLAGGGGTGSYENGSDGSLVWEDRPLPGGTVIVVR